MEAVAKRAAGESELEEILGPVEPPKPLEWIPVVAALGVERKRC